MVTIVVEPFRNFRDKLKIDKKWEHKGTIETLDNAVMITQIVQEYDGHRLDM